MLLMCAPCPLPDPFQPLFPEDPFDLSPGCGTDRLFEGDQLLDAVYEALGRRAIQIRPRPTVAPTTSNNALRRQCAYVGQAAHAVAVSAHN